MFLPSHPIVRMKVAIKKKRMPDENLSPESREEESVGISGGEEEESSTTRRKRSGRYSPHSTTTTGTTPPSRKRHPVTPKTEEEEEDEEEEEEVAAVTHAGSSAASDSDVDTSVDKNLEAEATTTPLKQILVAAIKVSGSISRQHCDRALQIVTDLLIGAIDSTEFQQRVTQLVHLPLRPLVLPLLDKHLNWLRRELAARLHPVRLLAQHTSGQQQTTTHFVKEHVKALLSLDRQLLQDSTESSASSQQPQLGVWQVFQPGVGAEGSPRTPPSGGSGTAAPASLIMAEATQLQQQPHNNNNNNNNTRKRRASASLVENGGGSGGDDAVEETRKRVALYSTHPPVWPIPPKGNGQPQQQQQEYPAVATNGQQRQLDREMSSTKSSSSSSFSAYPSTLMTSFQPQQGDEEWANIHTMLNCILSMVEKTRRALGILQQRASNDKQVQQQKRRDSSSSSSLIHHQQVTYEASELRRQAGELIAQTLKATEDRVSQVKRKAEEAVHDVRRAAMAELQRALSAERLRAERLAAEARRQGAEEALSALGQHAMMGAGSHHHHPTSSPANKEVCWNCGRRANETCSGCNVARYCSTFCQHKHWEIHHKICGRVSQVMLAAAAPSTGSSMDHQSESGGSPSSSSQQHGHRHSSKTPSPVQQQTNGSGPASYVH